MSRLLFVYENDMPTVSIMRGVFTHLKENNDLVSDFVPLIEVSPQLINNHDVIILIRPTNIYSWRIGKRAKRAGHTVITFCDDDLLNLPKNMPVMPWRKKGLINALKYSDVIWSSSQYILGRYSKLTMGHRTATINTIIQADELEGINTCDSNKSVVQIVYAASDKHSFLFDTYLKPILPQLVAEYGDRITVTFVGVHPDVSEVEGFKAEYVSGMPLFEYRKFMRERHFDIGVAPLSDDEFSKCKYFNKFIEYTTHGMVGIYSNLEPYTYVIKDGINGFLADNTPEAWMNAFRKAIDDEDLRKKCLYNAVNYLRENHSEKSIISEMKKDIPELEIDVQEYVNCSTFVFGKVLYFLFRPLDWMFLFWFYLVHNGISDVVDRTKKRIFHLNSYDKKQKTN